ncbi:MAG: hypothetical protein JXR49_22615, partial [Acidobacteria bacterium]|nr:hypothetical protein [Acidobacteriota bacterium]
MSITDDSSHGNKRVAVAAAEVLLLINEKELSASDKAVEDITLGVVCGRLSEDEVIEFFIKYVSDLRTDLMDTWKFYDITHREHVVCNPTSEEK